LNRGNHVVYIAGVADFNSEEGCAVHGRKVDGTREFTAPCGAAGIRWTVLDEILPSGTVGNCADVAYVIAVAVMLYIYISQWVELNPSLSDLQIVKGPYVEATILQRRQMGKEVACGEVQQTLRVQRIDVRQNNGVVTGVCEISFVIKCVRGPGG
jgi:hypothetical protein